MASPNSEKIEKKTTANLLESEQYKKDLEASSTAVKSLISDNDDELEEQAATALVVKSAKSVAITNPVPSDKADSKSTPIMEFAKLVIGAKFQTTLSSFFEKPGFSTLFQILAGFLQNFYYNIYTVPNLPNNKCIIVKPETLFVKIPKCNVILPCMKSNITFSRNSKGEPTRVFLVTNPLQILGAESGSKMATVGAIDFAPSSWKSGSIDILAYTGKTVSSKDANSWPVYKLTEYEKRLGPRLYQDIGGGDLLAFVEAGSIENDGNIKKGKASAEILCNLAKYKLLRARYIGRMGSVSMYFNPYITPGFPMASLEEQSASTATFNVYGYVTSVVHNISDSSWSTTVSFSAATTDGEVRPSNFPIAESEYDGTGATIAKTYANLFGSGECYTHNNISSAFADYTKEGTSVTDAYNCIKRPATTLKDHFSAMGYSLDIKQDGNVMVLTAGDCFNKDIQNAILSYSKSILDNDKHYALHTQDVR